jgi:hypothetical protein
MDLNLENLKFEREKWKRIKKRDLGRPKTTVLAHLDFPVVQPIYFFLPHQPNSPAQHGPPIPFCAAQYLARPRACCLCRCAAGPTPQSPFLYTLVGSNTNVWVRLVGHLQARIEAKQSTTSVVSRRTTSTTVT